MTDANQVGAKKKQMARFERGLLSCDKFSASFKFNTGDEGVRTKKGDLLSILMLVILISYTYRKIERLVNKKSIDVTQAVFEDYFDDDYQFTSRQGLGIAVGLTKEIDPSYGEIKFYLESIKDDTYDGKLIETRPCSRDELGLVEDGGPSSFMPIKAKQRDVIDFFSGSMLCLQDPSDLVIQGSFSTRQWSKLVVSLERCKGRTDCKPQDETDDYFRGSSFVLLSNQIRFDSQLYGEKSIIQESTFEYVPFSMKLQTLQPFKISHTKVELQDLAIDLDELTLLEDSSVFRLEAQASRPTEYYSDDTFVAGIALEMDPNLKVVQRNSYSILDLLSDIGGIEALLLSFFAGTLSALNYKNVENQLASRLYKLKSGDMLDAGVFNLKEYVASLLPKKLVCCSRSAKLVALEQARSSLESETDIIQMIQSLRFLEKAVSSLLSTQVVETLKHESKFKAINDADSDGVPPRPTFVSKFSIELRGNDINEHEISQTNDSINHTVQGEHRTRQSSWDVKDL